MHIWKKLLETVNNKKVIRSVFVIALLLAGLFFFFRPTLTSGFLRMQSDVGDTMFNNYLLEHSFRTVFDNNYKASSWSPAFFYPQQEALVYADNLWGAAPIYWLARIFSSPETSFQLWLIVITILNFLSFYLLARRLRAESWVAGVGAFLFAFCLPRSAQLGHQQILIQFFSVLALWSLVSFIEIKKFKYFILFLVFVYLQVLAGIYLGWFLFLALAVMALVALSYYWDKKIFLLFFSIKAIIGWFFLFLSLAATFYPYYLIKQDIGPWSYVGVKSMTPRLTSYFSVDSGSIFYDLYPASMKTAAAALPMPHEHRLFLGFFFIAWIGLSLVAFIIIKRKQRFFNSAKKGIYDWPPLIIVSAGSFLLISAISLYIPLIDFSFWRYIYEFVPGAGAIRAVSRIWTASYLFLFLLVVILVSEVYRRTELKAFKVILIIIGLLVCLEQINLSPSSFDKLAEKRIRQQLAQEITSLTSDNEISSFYVRWPEEEKANFYDYQLKAMWTGMELGLPTINGYSGRTPIGYKYFELPMNNCELGYWLVWHNKLPKKEKVLVLEAEINNKELIINKTEILDGSYLIYLINRCN